MKKLSILIVLAIVAFFTAGCFQDFPAKCVQTEQLSVPLAPGGELRVSTENGTIKVRSGDVKEVQITAEKTVRSRTDAEARMFCEGTKVVGESQPDGASVFVVLPEGHRHQASIAVSIDALVPSNCNLDLSTSNGGIEVAGIDGSVKMQTSNGRIAAQNISGKVIADTSNGAIELERVSGSAEALTSNGGSRSRKPPATSAVEPPMAAFSSRELLLVPMRSPPMEA